MTSDKRAKCDGPLIWFDADGEPPAAILECAKCGYVVITGGWMDEAHGDTPVLREGLV